MSLWRFTARSMLASYFIADGIAAVGRPETQIDQAEPWATAIAGMAHRALPPAIQSVIPSETSGFVRVHGALEIAGGLMLATGVLRRVGACLLVVSYLPKALAAAPGARHLTDRSFLREIALVGGAMIASLDRQGKPDLAWLIADRRQQWARAAGHTSGRAHARVHAPHTPSPASAD